MVQLDTDHAPGAEARVGGDDAAALEHDHAGGPQRHADALADEVRGDGVLDHADGDQGGAVDARVEDQAGVEVVGRQRCQVGQFGVVVLPDRVDVSGDAAGVVVDFPGADLVVEFVQGGDFGHGGEVVAAEPADLALDATFLVGAVDAWLAVERVEAVVGAEQHPAFVLVAQPVPAVDDLHHGRGEVVVADVTGRDTTQGVEGLDVSLEEGLLPARRVDAVNGLARVRQAVDEHVALGLDAVQDHVDLAEVDLGLRAGGVVLRHHRLHPAPGLQIDLRAPDPDVVPHRRVRQVRGAVLVTQPGQDPRGGVALLARGGQVVEQHLVDGRLVRVQTRCRADRPLAGWGFGRGECLADGAAVHSVFAGELADGQAIDSRVVADVGVQLHS
ncbi:Uncharacterised protein [Dermatophilus congolensis]|uniref:Uncharacterized protein n=1 Tax=Dermatophilus congolensis TaxID=1863 RepID=A0AA46BQ97_9MICO|nr:Uncharacterised protein [Dermatophilus congolensis]STD15198.1 Uncharacterised protein [Dermatophilus congolensis]